MPKRKRRTQSPDGLHFGGLSFKGGEDLVALLDRWREAQPLVPTRSTALRYLLAKALQAADQPADQKQAA